MSRAGTPVAETAVLTVAAAIATTLASTTISRRVETAVVTGAEAGVLHVLATLFDDVHVYRSGGEWKTWRGETKGPHCVFV